MTGRNCIELRKLCTCRAQDEYLCSANERITKPKLRNFSSPAPGPMKSYNKKWRASGVCQVNSLGLCAPSEVCVELRPAFPVAPHSRTVAVL